MTLCDVSSGEQDKLEFEKHPYPVKFIFLAVDCWNSRTLCWVLVIPLTRCRGFGKFRTVQNVDDVRMSVDHRKQYANFEMWDDTVATVGKKIHTRFLRVRFTWKHIKSHATTDLFEDDRPLT